MDNTTAKSWTSEEIQDICLRYQNGESYSEIGQSYGKSPDSIKGVIRRNKQKGNNLPGDGLMSSDDSAMQAYVNIGKTAPNVEEVNEYTETIRLRTHMKPSLIRPRRKEFGRYYTGMKYRRRVLISRF